MVLIPWQIKCFFASTSNTKTGVLPSNALKTLHGCIVVTENGLFPGCRAEGFHAQGIQFEVNALFLHSLQQAVSRKTKYFVSFFVTMISSQQTNSTMERKKKIKTVLFLKASQM